MVAFRADEKESSHDEELLDGAENWTMLIPLSRKNPSTTTLREVHWQFERIFDSWRDRYGDAGSNPTSRLKRVASARSAFCFGRPSDRLVPGLPAPRLARLLAPDQHRGGRTGLSRPGELSRGRRSSDSRASNTRATVGSNRLGT